MSLVRSENRVTVTGREMRFWWIDQGMLYGRRITQDRHESLDHAEPERLRYSGEPAPQVDCLEHPLGSAAPTSFCCLSFRRPLVSTDSLPPFYRKEAANFVIKIRVCGAPRGTPSSASVGGLRVLGARDCRRGSGVRVERECRGHGMVLVHGQDAPVGTRAVTTPPDERAAGYRRRHQPHQRTVWERSRTADRAVDSARTRDDPS